MPSWRTDVAIGQRFPADLRRVALGEQIVAAQEIRLGTRQVGDADHLGKRHKHRAAVHERVRELLAQPLVIALIAVPILIQVYFNSAAAYLLNRWIGEQHCVAGPSALIGASNFFELAVAAAISLFGLHSGAALATVVGVLIEVPVMLSVVKIVNGSVDWYEKSSAHQAKREAA